MTPTNFSGSKTSIPGQSTPFVSGIAGATPLRPSTSGFQVPSHPDSWPSGANTLRSPPKYAGTFNDAANTGTSASSRYESKGGGGGGSSGSSSASYPPLTPAASLPMATPLTNPGLMGGGATPNTSGMMGHATLPTPRRPSTPPREFRPSSPSSSLYRYANMAGGTAAADTFAADVYSSISCPSPSIHRHGATAGSGGGGVSASGGYAIPRSPVPEDSK